MITAAIMGPVFFGKFLITTAVAVIEDRAAENDTKIKRHMIATKSPLLIEGWST